MKFKDLETAKKYLYPIFPEDKLPSKLAEYNENFTKDEFEAFKNLDKEDEKIKNECLVIKDSYELYYYSEKYLTCIIDYGSRGQGYYLLCNIATLELSIIATKSDGSGSNVLLPNELLTWIKAGEIVL